MVYIFQKGIGARVVMDQFPVFRRRTTALVCNPLDESQGGRRKYFRITEKGKATYASDEAAKQARTWLDEKGLKFIVGSDDATKLTDAQILEQLKMYFAAIRMADAFGCEALGPA
jgi:hypothetical protein